MKITNIEDIELGIKMIKTEILETVDLSNNDVQKLTLLFTLINDTLAGLLLEIQELRKNSR